MKKALIVMLFILAACGNSREVLGKNTHGLASEGEEMRAVLADAGIGYVRSGCTHGTDADTTVSIASCKAFARETGPPPQLHYIEESGSRTFTYTAGDGTYWLALRGNMGATPGGWSCVAGTHYCWQLSATAPPPASNLLLVQKSTVLAGAITAVDTSLPPRGLFDFSREVNAAQYGMICDGVTDNSPALAAAHDALPLTGGHMSLPGSSLPCNFGSTFTISKIVRILGQGGRQIRPGALSSVDIYGTMLQYTGSGIAINLVSPVGNPGIVSGSILEGFELTHIGTASVGIQLSGGNHIQIRDVTMMDPPVRFSEAAVKISADSAFAFPHTNMIIGSTIRDAAPVGFKISRAIFTVVHRSQIYHHSACNLEIGAESKTTDVHIFQNLLETNQLGYTDSHAICARNVEGLFVSENHFELGQGAAAAVFTGSTDSQCEHCIIDRNYITLLNTAVQGNRIFSFDIQGTDPAGYVIIRNNYVRDARPVPTSDPFITVNNTSGQGGLSTLIVEGNEVPATIPLLINNASNVKYHYTAKNNYALGNVRDPEPHTLCSDYVGVGNVGTGEDNLMTCTVLRRRLMNDGLGVRLSVAGTTAANANTKQIRIKVSGTVVFDTGAIAANNQGWRVECNGIRATSTTMRWWCQGNLLSATMATTFTSVTGLSFGVDIPLSVTGEATANNDISMYYMLGLRLP